MGRKGVSYEDVVNAALRVLRAGQSATVARVRDQLGRGSYSTVQKHLQAWRSSLKDSAVDALPAGLPDELTGPLEDLWAAAMSHAERQYGERIATLEKDLAAAQVEAREHQDLLKTAERSREHWRREAEGVQSQLQEAYADLAAAVEVRRQYEEEVGELTRELQATRDTAAERIRTLRAQLRHQAERDSQTIQDLRADLEREAERHDATQTHWLKALDQTRDEYRPEIQRLQDEIKRLKADLHLTKEKLRKAQMRNAELEQKMIEYQ